MRRRRSMQLAVPSSGWNGQAAPIGHDPRRAMEGYDELPPEVRQVVAGAVGSMLCDWFSQCVTRGTPLHRIQLGTMLTDMGDIRHKRSTAKVPLPLDPFSERMLEEIERLKQKR